MVPTQLGKFGVWTTYGRIGEPNAGEAARLVEDLGFGTFWLGGSPRLPSIRPLLEASERLTVATGIVNIWQYDPADLAAEHAELMRDFPGRLLVGIGIGHPEAISDWAHPLTAMQRFLDGLDAAPEPLPADERCVAALGPKMLELSGQKSMGAVPYNVTPKHTAQAARILGKGKILAVEQKVTIETDPAKARALGRKELARYMVLPNYRNNWLREGFSEADLANGGSDKFIDAMCLWGDAATIKKGLRAHFDAGATHVCLQPVHTDGDFAARDKMLAALADT
jgi:probable F420-dependent oxidoreductase